MIGVYPESDAQVLNGSGSDRSGKAEAREKQFAALPLALGDSGAKHDSAIFPGEGNDGF
jgi:hypothetical protein